MKKIVLALLITLALFAFCQADLAHAGTLPYLEPCVNHEDCMSGYCREINHRCGCTDDSHCPSGFVCHTYGFCLAGSATPSPEEIVGAIDAPPGVAKFNAQADSGLGIILFFSNLIRLIAIIAGLWTMLNFILAGFTYVTSADNPSAIEKIGPKLSSSVIGLAIIVASYTLAAVFGLIIFGDASFIISPEIPSITVP